MESSNLSLGNLSPKQVPSRRHGVNSPRRDIWFTVRNGTVYDVEMALTHLKKTNGNIDARNAFGSSALHIAAWRNHLPILRRLLAAGADPNSRDGESGWSSLHRALHFGHLAVAGVLIEAGGSLVIEDSKGRTPIDLTSGPLKQSLTSSNNRDAKEVFSWGSGSNYQLGIGSTGFLRVPGHIDTLQGLDVIAVAAAKFHSVALTVSGEVYSWGFGRGGRLGHPDFDIHSGQVAVITPRQIVNSFRSRAVRVIAVAKHHTVVATNVGEVYTWGSNREGRLGYPSVDTQPTPRRVSTLKARVVAVTAANKHSAVLTEAGEVYTWGCNSEGQLGYGTSNSTSNYLPHLVECLKGRRFISVSAAKCHTIVLGTEGEVLTWGFRMVNPHRVPMARYTKKAGILPLKFHISERLNVVAISAGMTHSTAISDDGLVFYWFSADPQIRCYQLLSMGGHQVVSVSSSKYRTAVLTSTGDVYSWDGDNSKADSIPIPFRVHGVKHVSQLSVGENHSVLVASFFIPKCPLNTVSEMAGSTQPLSGGVDCVDVDPELEEGFAIDRSNLKKGQLRSNGISKAKPSLRNLCERVIAQSILEPKNALQVLEFADSLGAGFLQHHCEEVIVQNLDYILAITPFLFGHMRPSLLARVEKLLDSFSTKPWSYRQQPGPVSTLPAIIDSEEEDGLGSNTYGRVPTREFCVFNTSTEKRTCTNEGFLRQASESGEAILKQMRAARKKLQQIEALELKQARGHILDDQQLAKLQAKRHFEELLLSLEMGIIPETGRNICGQEFMNGKGIYQKSISVGGVSKRTDCYGQQRRWEKKRGKEQGLSEHLQREMSEIVTPSMDTLATTSTHIPKNESCESPEVAKPTMSRRFLTISGFTSQTTKQLLIDLPEQDVHSLRKNLVEGVSSSTPGLQADVPPISQQAPLPYSLLSPEHLPLSKKLATAGKRKLSGGLSLFLSGALDEPPKFSVPAPAPVTLKAEAPAWGGAHAPRESTSLRAIQNQQKIQPKLSSTNAVEVVSGSCSSEENTASDKQIMTRKGIDRNHVVEDAEIGTKRVPLSQFVHTTPIAVISNSSSRSVHVESGPPPWAGVTLSPASLSLRDIQLQQGKSKAQHKRPSNSPNLASQVGATCLLAGGSSFEHNLNSVDTPNRWFKPQVDTSSTLRCIQIEETAMKELRKLYKNVKLVRNDES